MPGVSTSITALTMHTTDDIKNKLLLTISRPSVLIAMHTADGIDDELLLIELQKFEIKLEILAICTTF